MMGLCCNCSDDVRITPQNSIDKQDSDFQFDGDVVVKKRTSTDVVFLIAFAIFIIIWVALVSYCIANGDIYRILNGYDNCGNVCGRANYFSITPSGCRGVDLTQHKYLRVQSSGTIIYDTGQVNRICVENCEYYPGFKTFFNRCIPEKSKQQINTFFSKTGITEFFQEASEDLNTCWEEIIYLCVIAFALSLILVIMFKYIAGFVVWLVLLGIIFVSIALTAYLWARYKFELDQHPDNQIGKRRVQTLLGYAIAATIVTIMICLVILALRKRIRLVIQLFREAGKALTNMPLLLFEPILTFISLSVIIALFFYFSIWIESAGYLRIEGNKTAKYVKDDVMKVTRWYNVMALLWYAQFIIGCQHMVISGAVATWFFTRNKRRLDSPILASWYNLLRYHLGTVALGSFLIAAVQFLRIILKYIEYMTSERRNRFTRCIFSCCQCCLACFERSLRYLSRNAYIETATYGYPFCEAGQKAFFLLANNVLQVFAINSVGDFVLLLGKVLVVAITVFIGMDFIQTKEGVHHNWVPLILAGLFAYLISHSFITVYEMTIDTIFLCFCEDCERNNGLSRPYYMSQGLMEFVQNSKQTLQVGSARTIAWSGSDQAIKRSSK